MTQYNRTIDVQFEFDDISSVVTGVDCVSDPSNVDVSVSGATISVDLIHYQAGDRQMQVIIDSIYQGYTPQKGIDYWTDDDVREINHHTEYYVEENAIRWGHL